MASFSLPGGRRVHFTVSGTLRPGEQVLVFHHGQPGAGLVPPPLGEVAARHGLAVVAVSRPGYASSERCEGRSVADGAADVVAVLDHLGAGRFVTCGWSGGGPHALACGALAAPRCTAVASIAGVAPYHGVDDLDWTAGMGPENVAELSALVAGDPSLEAGIASLCEGLAQVRADTVVDLLGGLISEPDRQCLEAGFSTFVAEWFRLAAAGGHHGYWDDDQAFVAPWGFDLGDLSVPVSIWWAGRDLMVPASHGEWLAAHVAGAAGFCREGEGHISLLVEHIGEIVDRLVSDGL